MPNYAVQDNPYYRQPRGKNLITDRLLAALQSFSAPKSGAYGPKAGFGSALLGSDVNRMNTAAQMRQQDVAAGQAPFQAEVAQEDAHQGRQIGAQFGLQSSANDAAMARENVGNQAAAARQQTGIDATRNSQESQNRWNEIEQNNRMMQQQSQQLLRDQLLVNKLRTARSTPQAMSEYQAAQLKQPRAIGGNAAYFPGTGQIKRFGEGFSEGSSPDFQIDPADMRYLRGESEPSGEHQPEQPAGEDLDIVRELFNPSVGY